MVAQFNDTGKAMSLNPFELLVMGPHEGCHVPSSIEAVNILITSTIQQVDEGMFSTIWR